MISEKDYLDLNVIDLTQKDQTALIYSREIEEQLIEEAKKGYPNEIVGFLIGKKDRNEIVTGLYPVLNIAEHQERRFEIHGVDYLKVEMYALQNNLDVIGIYHSHPDYPALPSIHDLEYAQGVFAYAIISIDGSGSTLINSWKKRDGKFINQRIEIKS
jgi:proteasome lid subunit RPN8/RPN11